MRTYPRGLPDLDPTLLRRTGPVGVRHNDPVRLDSQKALTHRLIFIGGEEGYLRRKTLDELLAAAGVGPEDFDFASVNADEQEPIVWMANASTAPFMDEKRTVLVRQVLRADPRDDKTLIDKLKALPDSARLILFADDEAGSDDKLRRMQTIHKAWEDLVKKAGGFTIVHKSDPKEFVDFVRDVAKTYDKTMSFQAANVLSEIVGGSITRAVEEFDKLAIYVGDREAIKESDIKHVATPSREWNVYKMVEAAIDGSTGSAIRQLRILVGSATKAEDASFRLIFPTLSRQFRLIWQARVAQEMGMGAAQALFPSKPNLNSESAWGRDKAVRFARKLTLSQIHACMAHLADADARLKGALPGYSAMETLERLLLAIVDTVQNRAAA